MTDNSNLIIPKFNFEQNLPWLLDSDPAIRWQVLQDLMDSPADQVAMERAKVTTQGWGAEVLALQRANGTWGGVAWNHGWDSTMHALTVLHEFGLDPNSEPAIKALALVRENVTWADCGPEECANNAFFTGEIEPCINGQVASAGAYFGQDVSGLIDRLLGEQLSDGGWNCEAEFGSTRGSFHTTICVLEALLAYETQTGGSPEISAARLRGQDYLLERHLFRKLSTGEAILRDSHGVPWTSFAYPHWWHYDTLRGLDYLRRAGVQPDQRLAEAVAMVQSKRQADGRWLLDIVYPGKMLLALGAREGQPSRWITLLALRVLRWYFR